MQTFCNRCLPQTNNATFCGCSASTKGFNSQKRQRQHKLHDKLQATVKKHYIGQSGGHPLRRLRTNKQKLAVRRHGIHSPTLQYTDNHEHQFVCDNTKFLHSESIINRQISVDKILQSIRRTYHKYKVKQ